MLRKLGFLALTTLTGLLTVSACTVKTPDDPADPSPNDTGSQAVGQGEAGAGGGAGDTTSCAGCSSGACLDDGTCVDCTPSNDKCPSGEYCGGENSCVRGCKDESSCASGVCGSDHNCKKCIDDSECTDDNICSGGECSPVCTAAQEGGSKGCGLDLMCCDTRCTDLMTDNQNCGACGNACKDGQFCGLTECEGDAKAGSCVKCHDATLANVCSVAKVIVILDTNKNDSDGNRVPGRAMGATLAEQCPTAPKLSEAEQDSVEALNITTGRPVSNSSELLVVAGGPFYQNLEGYLEENGVAPLHWKVRDDVAEFRTTKGDELVADLAIAGDHESHDIFIIQFMRDPDSGSLVLNAQGFWLSGTVAAAYQLNNTLLPELTAQDKAWYAYDWTDKDGDKAPDADEIELLTSGE
jgi:stigma-specific protein Stig1